MSPTQTSDKVRPKTLRGILKLCSRPDIRRLEVDSTDASMAGPRRSTAFLAMCRHHRRACGVMEINDLAKLIRKDNDFWGIALASTVERLKRHGAIPLDYVTPNSVVKPKNRHPKNFVLG